MYDKEERIICPICSKKYQILSSHVSRSHGITSKELLERYPGTKIMTDYQRNRVESDLRRSREKNWTDESYKLTMREAAVRNMKELNDDPVIRKKALDNSIVANKVRRGNMNPDEYYEERSTAAKKGWMNESRQLAHSIMLKELWKDPDYREKHSERFRQQMLDLWSDPDAVANTSMGLDPKNFRNEYVSPDGSLVVMRSSWEVLVATILDNHNIDYKYEGLVIPYEQDTRRRSYVTDFLIGDLVLEVKPKRFIDDEVVLLKKEATIREGYNFMFITEDELSLSEEKLIDYILEKSSTTNCRA